MVSVFTTDGRIDVSYFQPSIRWPYTLGSRNEEQRKPCKNHTVTPPAITYTIVISSTILHKYACSRGKKTGKTRLNCTAKNTANQSKNVCRFSNTIHGFSWGGAIFVLISRRLYDKCTTTFCVYFCYDLRVCAPELTSTNSQYKLSWTRFVANEFFHIENVFSHWFRRRNVLIHFHSRSNNLNLTVFY